MCYFWGEYGLGSRWVVMVVCAFDVVGLCTVLLGCGEFVYILAGAGGCGAVRISGMQCELYCNG
jgi:hypothetical protein